MSRKFSVFFLFIFLAIAGSFLVGQKKIAVKDLPDTYRKWLTEDVVYIISPKERDIFLQLETDRERNIFIEAFWKQRDPTPNTPKNEFKEEHYRRISYANTWFGRESPDPGWRTDRGKIHIILGQPKSIDRYQDQTLVFPTEVWFYEGMADYGLPNAFNVVFFKEGGLGQYKLYTPFKYGPHFLLPNFEGDARDIQSAYKELLAVSPSLANVSLSLIPGEMTDTQTVSMASEILVRNKIPVASYEKVKDAYAEKLLKYKDRIDVEYTANYIESDGLLQVIQDKFGTFFVHYLLEPKKLSFEEYDNKYQTWLLINGTVSDSSGAAIHQLENKIPLEYTEDQMLQIMNKLFSYQDIFPIVPGHYKFNLLLKNEVSKEFTSLEAEISVPEAASLQIGPLLLANKIIRDSKYKGLNKPFQVGNVQLVPSPRNDFTASDTAYLFFQVFGLTEDFRQNGILEMTVFKEENKVLSRERSLKDYPDPINVLEEFPLAAMSPGFYSVKAALFDGAKKEISSKQVHFSISSATNLPRPWVLSLSQPAPDDPSYINMLGNQYMNKNNLVKARPLLEEAFRKRPRAVKFALDYSQVLYRGKDYDQVLKIAFPFLQGENKYDFLEVVGQSELALNRHKEAISYFKEYLAHFGTNLNILNSIGDCYFQLGDREEALVAWERSLAINPKQEDLIKKIQQLKEKK